MPKEIDDGGPAFPFVTQTSSIIEGYEVVDGEEVSAGLTKRELFAAMAMQGMLAHKETPFIAGEMSEERGDTTAIFMAEMAVEFSDALIAKLKT